MLDAGGNISTASGLNTSTATQTAGGSITGVSGGTYNSGFQTATLGPIDIDATGNAVIAGYSSGGTADIESSGGDVDITAAGQSTGNSIITSGAGSVTTQNITSNADIVLMANTALTTSVLDAGGNISTNSGGNTSAATQTAVGMITGTSGGTYDSGQLTATTGPINVTSAGTATIAGYASSGAATITSSGGNVDITAAGQSAGNSIITSGAGSVTTRDITSNADIVLMATTDLNTDVLDTGGNISTNSGGNTSTGTQTAGGMISGVSGGDTTVGALNANSVAINSQGTFTAEMTIDALDEISITSQDIVLNQDVTGAEVTLTVLASADPTDTLVLIGDGSGGSYDLSSGELALINTPLFMLNSGAANIQFADVALALATGSDNFDIRSDGNISFIGNFSADGSTASRLFRFGGVADGSLASQISADILTANLNFGAGDVEFSAQDIIFGLGAFQDEVSGLTTDEVASAFVGNSSSSLYNLLLSGNDEDTTGLLNTNYLTTGNLTLNFGGTALFQNTGAQGVTSGVTIGEAGGPSVLTILPENMDNAFAFFGVINGLEGQAAALAGGTIVTNTNLATNNPRVNGCIIGSAAGCLTNQFVITTVEVPDDDVILISSDNSLLVPFDPLTGSNNEGLFSDAASNFVDCDRDANGNCLVAGE